ncbi:Acyl-CoA synthetase (AMP-forming)/AMP-acid ligase II [Streptosporangium subroseum]|uniref:Acyl-CoA synthetase (AMP-forming)/AMP-acid ligase II n=1 Tax=Streptosporangium subroseum TaxID=106412 RepID=A0A239INF0_9ACTN|nr:class I adenylate-forming enzyme family protein [Streptosporangium subroseum]SNS95180.1 Acyl-CoA synthetase (AMP-forming)/AMP-acid ligase II [Streptosporangium subroseum]
MNDIITGIMTAAEREPERIAVIDGRGREVTYGELARRVNAVRDAMTERPGPEAPATVESGSLPESPSRPTTDQAQEVTTPQPHPTTDQTRETATPQPDLTADQAREATADAESGPRPRETRAGTESGLRPGKATADTKSGPQPESGLRPGDGVLFAVRPGVDAVVLALGAVAAGGTLVLADPGLAPDVLAARLAVTHPKWVVTESLLYTLSGPLRGLARRRGLLLPNLRDPLPGWPVRHLYTGPWLPGVPRGALRLSLILGSPGSSAPATSSTPGRTGIPDTQGTRTGQTGHGPYGSPTADQPAAVIFTSGTTARPRGVVHTRGSLAAGLELFRRAFPLGPGDIVHTDQLMLGLPALLAGATWSLPGGGDLAAELAERKATHTFAVPVHLDRLLRETPRLPGTLRYLLLGAAPAPPGVLRRAIEAGPEVLSIYAMTEALPIAIASAREKLAQTEGDLLGAPLPGVGVRIADDGELFVSGPHLAQRYLGEEPLKEIATGDLVRLEEGRLVLLGRKKDMLLRDGVNIYPGLYEPAIAALPGVAEAAIVGLPDPETGDEEVVLVVIPTGDYDESRLREAIPEIVDAAAVPDRIESLDAFPRSGRAGKLDRAALRELVARRV